LLEGVADAMRKNVLFLLKLAVSVLLLYFVLRPFHLGALSGRLANFSIAWGLAAVALCVLQVVLLGLRWSAIAGPHVLPAGAAVRLSFIGSFFGQLLPSTVGGDAARVVLLARRGAGWAKATHSVLADRVIGLLMLAIIVLGCILLTFARVTDPLARLALLAVAAAAIAGASVFFLLRFYPFSLLTKLPFGGHLAEASWLAQAVLRVPRTATVVTICSLAGQLAAIAIAWCCARAVAAPVPFFDLLALVPPVLLIATAPVSIAGWGLREGTMATAFTLAGLSGEDGVLISLLFGLVYVVTGCIGGLIWIASGAAKPLPDESEQAAS
jgi:glycosyltransferase 2 family protein